MGVVDDKVLESLSLLRFLVGALQEFVIHLLHINALLADERVAHCVVPLRLDPD